MCLIIICKPDSEKNPSESEFLKKCINNAYIKNRDGWGYAYNINNRIKITKSLDDDQALIDSLSNTKIPKESTLVIHLRNTSVGSTDIENTHPFVLTDDDDAIISNNVFTKKPVLFHNGTFWNYRNHLTTGVSDTYRFCKDFMRIPEFYKLLRRDESLFTTIFDVRLGTNKICVLYNDGVYSKAGNFLKTSDPQYNDLYEFSNDQYLDPPKNAFNWNSWEKEKKERKNINFPTVNKSHTEQVNDDYEEQVIKNYKGSNQGGAPTGFSVEPGHPKSKYDESGTNLDSSSSTLYSGSDYNTIVNIPIIVTKSNFNELYIVVKKEFMKLLTGYAYYIKKYDDDIISVYSPNDPSHTYILPTDKLIQTSNIYPRKGYVNKYLYYRRLKRDLEPTKNHIRLIGILLKRAFETNNDWITVKKIGQFTVESAALYYEEYKSVLTDKELNIYSPMVIKT